MAANFGGGVAEICPPALSFRSAPPSVLLATTLGPYCRAEFGCCAGERSSRRALGLVLLLRCAWGANFPVVCIKRGCNVRQLQEEIGSG